MTKPDNQQLAQNIAHEIGHTLGMFHDFDTNPTPAAPKMTYYGLTSNAFKTRYNQHKVDFRDPKKRGSTKLSNHIWELKEKNVPHEVNWSVKARAMTYKPGSKRCDLCLVEKTDSTGRAIDHPE